MNPASRFKWFCPRSKVGSQSCRRSWLEKEQEQKLEKESESESESDVDVVVIGAAPHVKRLNDISNLDSSLLSLGSDCSRGFDHSRLWASVCQSVGQPAPVLWFYGSPVSQFLSISNCCQLFCSTPGHAWTQSAPASNPAQNPFSICYLLRGHGLTAFQIERINKCQSGSNRRQWSNE